MYTQKPHPGRRRLLALVTVTLALLIPSISAEPTLHDGLSHQELFEHYATRGEIHMDTELLHRRADESGSIATATGSSPSSATSDSADSPLPSAFDTSLGSNFTSSSCPTFFNDFLANSTYQQCTPLSLLLQNSQGFFSAQRNPTLLKKLMDTACSAPISICAATLSDIARQLTQDAHCGADFRARQPLVIQAYNGLLGYEAIATTSCLKTSSYNSTSDDPSADNDAKDAQYCFTAALTNKANPSDPFPYYTAIGMTLPSVAKPTCNGCLKSAMDTFAKWAVKSEQPLSMTYMSCAQIVNGDCGVDFADVNVQVGSVSSSSGMKNTEPDQTSGASALLKSRPVGGAIAGAAAVLALLGMFS